jgi:HK97 family phage major capsid protein
MKDNLTVFTEDQRAVLVDLIDIKAKERLEELVAEKTVSKDDLNLTDEEKVWRKDAQRLETMQNIWKNNGYVKGTNKRVTIQELVKKDKEITAQMQDNFSTDHPLLIPRVISNMAREAVEPNLVLTPLLATIQHSAGTRLVFPSWGAIHAADIGEGEEYPERSLELAGNVECIIGKSGVAIKCTAEMLRYSQFDVLNMHIRAAGRALARWKEKKVADMITTEGVTLIDNTSTSYKSTTGRDAAGAYNGTLSLDDLFYAYAQMINSGFTPNTLIMNPFAWQIFANEGIARAFGFINGMNPLMWQTAQGSPGAAPQWRAGGGAMNGTTYVSSPQQLASTFTRVPSIFPTNFNIIISPYMEYDTSDATTTVALCDVNELGIMVVDEGVVTDQWEDLARDITKIKFRERYGVASMNGGKGIGLLKGIKVARSFDFSDQISLSLTGLTNGLTGDASYSGIV